MSGYTLGLSEFEVLPTAHRQQPQNGTFGLSKTAYSLG
jgi:hypothetical protein